MMYSIVWLFSISLLAIPARACEGQCIVQVTHAFIGNYSVPVQHVFAEAALQIAKTILPSRSIATASRLIEPLFHAYQHIAYDTMEKGIFPGYFHGKCQVNGVDPAGCPNPDCPVVCGTPGSMVHFYPVLQMIAFNATSANLQSVCSPSSKTYKTLEAAMLREIHAEASRRRSLRSAVVPSPVPYYTFRRRSGLLDATEFEDVSESILVSTEKLRKRRETTEAQARLKSICQDTVNSLAKQCGGKAKLPNCSWEKQMKTFILSFP